MVFKTATFSTNVKITVKFKNIDDDVEKGDGDVSGRYIFLNSHNLSQRENSSTLKNIYGCVDKGDVISGYGYMNSHTDLHKNDLASFMNDNDSIDTDMNETLHNGDVSSGIGLLNIHTLPQANESSKLNDKNLSVDNGDIYGDYFCMNSSTGYFINNHNSIDYTKKRDGISTNTYLRENNGLLDGVDIDDMLLAYPPNKYVKI